MINFRASIFGLHICLPALFFLYKQRERGRKKENEWEQDGWGTGQPRHRRELSGLKWSPEPEGHSEGTVRATAGRKQGEWLEWMDILLRVGYSS